MTHQLHIVYSGKPLEQAQKALIMLHGRGADAESILSLSRLLNVADYALLAPQATNQTWYPRSFLAPVTENEPWLSSALNIVDQTLETVLKSGIKIENVYILGFSQGACLTLEFVARNARKYGGIVAFTGGLIGDRIERENYKGDFDQTPVFIGTSNPDFHVPVERVYASADILQEMNASVTEKVYTNRGHTISEDEIEQVNRIILT
ncbi:dienelactone hydrolase family protein [uncultured Proteiniphilum sp.]|uniref:alpha/beta hydrolase n=1 Tax=uncultured Proteiniphilum sp. TaxID=497637 RepID=UPI002615FC3D|nr:dienelactone hydrolase family protein [uncultured Proteiniphilum sp.]